MEAEQHPMVPLMKQLTMKILQCFTGIKIQGLGYLEEVDPDYKRAELTRRRIVATLAHYEQVVYKKRREAMGGNS